MRKFLLYLLVITVALSVCGCSGGKSAETAENKTVTLTWFVPGDKQPDISSVMNEVNKITENKIGAKLDLQFIDSGAYTERMTMNMASSNKFDLCFTGYVNPYIQAATNGGLLPIKGLMEKETPKLLETVPSYIWADATYKNEIYAVPNEQIVATSVAMVVKKDLADKYHLDTSSIRATEDIEPFLEQVKKNEPNIYPFRAGGGAYTAFLSLDKNDFQDSLVSGLAAVENPDGKVEVVWAAKRDRITDSAKKLHDWFEKDYIRKDVASIMDDSQDMLMGKYAAWLTTYKPGVAGEHLANYGYEVAVMPVSYPYMGTMNAKMAMTGIGKNSEHPVQAIKLIELFNTDKELYNLICFGVEGKHYNKTGDNRIELIGNSGYAPNASWKFGNQFNAYLVPGQDDHVWEETKKINNESAKSKLLGFMPNLDSIRTEVTQIETVLGEYKCINTGVDDPDGYYNEYLSKLDNAGIEKARMELQKQVDAFLNQ